MNARRTKDDAAARAAAERAAAEKEAARRREEVLQRVREGRANPHHPTNEPHARRPRPSPKGSRPKGRP